MGARPYNFDENEIETDVEFKNIFCPLCPDVIVEEDNCEEESSGKKFNDKLKVAFSNNGISFDMFKLLKQNENNKIILDDNKLCPLTLKK